MKFNESKKIVKDMERVASEIKDMVTIMGVYAINHYKKSFRDGGFTDEGFTPWKKRKSGRDRKKGSIRNASGGTRSLKMGRGVLIKTRALSRSLTARGIGRYSVRIQSNLPYAKVHNEGETINVTSRSGSGTINARVRGSGKFVNGVFTKGRSKKIQLQGASYTTGPYQIKMPKRQFVGYSGVLSRKIEKKLDSKIRRIFK